MKKLLIVVDMQNDFLTGSLANKDAVEIVPIIKEKLKSKKYYSNIFTFDTHQENYLDTKEGKLLPVPHCIIGTDGHKITEELSPYVMNILQKPTFGFKDWKCYMDRIFAGELPDVIELCGTCTDICVASNALILKAVFPEVEIVVDSDACAGLTKEKHEAALEAMRSCQITVI